MFLLGPSHHYYTLKCFISRATIYKTPLGDLPIDLEVNEELRASGKFEVMDLQVDEAEHSMEMHVPYLAKVFQEWPVKLVPILVDSLSSESEAMYGCLLAKKEGAIYKSIEALDKKGMEIIDSGDPDAFKDYLLEYDNTICGRRPISVFLHMLRKCSLKMDIYFIQYEQSSQCRSMRDSSVSYASTVSKVKALKHNICIDQTDDIRVLFQR